MDNNQLRALISQEVSRASLIETFNKNDDTKEDNSETIDEIIGEYTNIVSEIARHTGMSVGDANNIVAEALRNEGKLQIDETTHGRLDEGFWGTVGKRILGFYSDVFAAAQKALSPEEAAAMPTPEKMATVIKDMDTPKEEDEVIAMAKDAVPDDLEGGDDGLDKLDQEIDAAVEANPEAAAGGEGEGGEGEEGGDPGPVPLFKGDGALYSKLYSSIKDRLSQSEWDEAAKDKAGLQNAVKSILKDLSAQLRINGIKVTESQIPLLSILIVERLKKSVINERRNNNGSFTDPKTGETGAATGNRASRRSHMQDQGGPETGEDAENIRKKEKAQSFKPGGDATNSPTAGGGRVKPTKGQIEAGRAVAGKIQQLVASTYGADPSDMKDIRKGTQKVVTAVITKIVKPFLDKYLAGKEIKLKEDKFNDLTLRLTSAVLDEVIRRKKL